MVVLSGNSGTIDITPITSANIESALSRKKCDNVQKEELLQAFRSAVGEKLRICNNDGIEEHIEITTESIEQYEHLKSLLAYYAFMLPFFHPAVFSRISINNLKNCGSKLMDDVVEGKKAICKVLEKCDREKPNFIERIYPFIRSKAGILRSSEDRKKIVRMYDLVKEKFEGAMRKMKTSDGKDIEYFSHLKQTLLIKLLTNGAVSVNEICIMIGHDLLEDTDVEFDKLRIDFGDEVAFGIKALSKESSKKYVTLEYGFDYKKSKLNGKNKIEKILEAYNLKEKVQSEIKIKKDDSPKKKAERRNWKKIMKDEYGVKQETFDGMRKASNIRNIYYLLHLKKIASIALGAHDKAKNRLLYIDPITENILTERTENCITLDPAMLLNTKFDDVIDNFATFDGMSDKARVRKLREVETFVLPIAEELNIKKYGIIQARVEKRKGSINDYDTKLEDFKKGLPQKVVVDMKKAGIDF